MEDISLSHHEKYSRSKVRFVTGLSFALGFLDAYFIYLISTYFSEVGGSEKVGLFYFIVFGLAFLAFYYLSLWLRKLGHARLFLMILILLITCSAFLSLREPSWTGSVVLLVFLVANNMMWTVMDVILESYSTDQVSGRVRGMYLAVLNTGFLFAPFLSTLTLGKSGFGGVFTVLTIGYGLVFIGALLGLRDGRKVTVTPLRLIHTWRRFRKQPNLLYIYAVSLSLELFYAIMVVYMPIYLTVELGFSWEQLGIIFTIMLLPFVFLQYPIGVLADRRFGEKEMILIGLVVMGGSTLAAVVLNSSSIFIWGVLLFCTRIGSAALEVLRDAYFYKQITASDADIIVFFRTARSVGNMLGAVIALGCLYFLPLSSLFWLVGGVTLFTLYPAWRLVDTEVRHDDVGEIMRV